MPRFDQHCTQCPWQGEVVAAPFEMPACPSCGAATERLWISSARVTGDEIPGGVWIENLGREPVQFFSKREIVKEAKRRGLEPFVRHVSVPGSDKSPHTTSWAAVSPYQMEQARILLERVGQPSVEREARPLVGPLATPDLVREIAEGLSHE